MIENYEGKTWTFGELKEEFARLGVPLVIPNDAADNEEVYSIYCPILSPHFKRVLSPWSYVRYLRKLEQKEKKRR